jgi:predicted peptidase
MPQTTHIFTSPTAPGVTLNYLVYLPPDYDATQTYPLILFLHGAGERGDDVNRITVTGLPQRLDEGRDIRFIVVSPQCPEDDWWSVYRFLLNALLDHVMATYPIDQKRVYLTGLSMGGYGTWEMAFKYPQRFAAIAPICGGLLWAMPPEKVAPVLKDMPAWVFLCPIRQAKRSISRHKRRCRVDTQFPAPSS